MPAKGADEAGVLFTEVVQAIFNMDVYGRLTPA